MMNVLPIAGFSAVVSPRSRSSFTLHSRGSPSHPLRSLPVNSVCMPLGSAGAVRAASAARTLQESPSTASQAYVRIIFISMSSNSDRFGWIARERNRGELFILDPPQPCRLVEAAGQQHAAARAESHRADQAAMLDRLAHGTAGRGVPHVRRISIATGRDQLA